MYLNLVHSCLEIFRMKVENRNLLFSQMTFQVLFLLGSFDSWKGREKKEKIEEKENKHTFLKLKVITYYMKNINMNLLMD